MLPRLQTDLLRLFATTLPPASWTRQAIEARRRTRLRRLVRYAAEHLPRYRALFREHRLDPEAISSVEALRHLPVIEPVTTREEPGTFRSDEVDPRTIRFRTTSGLSGLPLRIPHTRLEQYFELFLWIRGYRQYGLRARDRQAKLSLPKNIPSKPYFLQRLGFFQRQYCSITARPEEKLRWLRATRPRALFGWASQIHELCLILEERKAHLSIPLVFCTSDMLWPQLRERIKQRLEARVVDVYGSVETGPIAWECPEGHGYHVHDDLTICEILDEDNRPVTRGRLVVTPLWRRAFVLLRYALGDLAEWGPSPCPCGSPYPILKHLHGREQELVRLPGGGWISAGTLKACVIGIPGIRQYQFVQVSERKYMVHIRPASPPNPQLEPLILQRWQALFGSELSLAVRLTDELHIPPKVKFSTLITRERLEQLERSDTL